MAVSLVTLRCSGGCGGLMFTGFILFLENLERPGFLLCYFLGLGSPGKRLMVLESSGTV